MKLGTHIRLADGREGTVVFNGLTGVGIKWGIHYPDPADFEGTCGDLLEHSPEVMERLEEWLPEAMLREPYKTADLPCVGTDYEIIKDGAE